MTDEHKRIQELEELIYNMDFACRCCVDPADAVRTIRNLTVVANLPSVMSRQPGGTDG